MSMLAILPLELASSISYECLTSCLTLPKIMTLIPPTFQWFLQLLGFESDLYQALIDLKEAWQVEASFGSGGAMLLTWIYSLLLKAPAKATAIIQEVSLKKTRSPLLCYTEGTTP